MKLKKFTLVFLFFMIIAVAYMPTVNGQNLTNFSNLSIKLALSPPHVEGGQATHPIGYVYILNSNGVPITLSDDIRIILDSENPDIATVPNSVVLPANTPFVNFDVNTGAISGETTISASFDGKTSFQKFRVGVNESYLPDDVILKLNLPTNDMHVNSIMPFSVYLKTPDGHVLRAPHDIKINLDYEDSLASPNKDTLTIKNGEYYSWGTIETNQKVGNTFLRAIQAENDLDTAESIRISSTLPSSLSISVFPKYITAEVDRTVDIFVSLLDSEGNPTVTPKDIPLKFFSNNQNYVGDDLDESTKENKPVIKKGEFGYHLHQELDLLDFVSNDIMIGVSAEGYGVDTDTFSTVGESFSVDNEKLGEKQVKVFGLDRIPSDATSIIVYQMNTIEEDDDDSDEVTLDENGNDVETNSDTDSDDILIQSIDDLDDDELYPIQANSNYYPDGHIQLLEVVSGNNELIQIQDEGKIKSSYSYGTAKISSGKHSGQSLVSATIKGIGSDSLLTEVVNSLEQQKMLVFSPTGEDTILFDRDGYFDVFLVSLDSDDRPKMMEQNSKYLITPTNGLLKIEKGNSFAFGTLRSDSFDIDEGVEVDLTVVPIGESADLDLESTKTFVAQPSSKLVLTMPMKNLNVRNDGHVGIVQLVDLQGKPMPVSKPINTKISSSDENVVLTFNDATIPTGKSYNTFEITTTGELGKSTVLASAKGVIGAGTGIETSTSLTKLKIYTGGFAEKIPVNKPYEVKLYIDDENAETIEGALVKIIANESAVVTPEEVKTAPDGSAIFNIKPLEGPKISFDILATAEGYVDDKETITLPVDSPDESISFAELEFPEWVVYIAISALIMVAVLVVLFLRKSRENWEEDWEEEEI
ncbi:MAG: hypothetical protein GWN01_00895 [Nitrosopumilaceae archaeon]|nr:hypothetical protein [Nitrosopumilaceae archaeon]NIT99535.1 hypothetical protein [Nitrosopumilaceae archaeon]NIU85910.1 hypothetical protein [Nitrosopumilaceae archaeon]NIV64744.1 hypothetical protein [Nitrosopumilaceae archaeon]NIX60138.1 hypothetical protein [Nitrosopumilaceae archaeon]